MREPTGGMTRVVPLGGVIAGCAAWRLPVGAVGAAGLARALAEHRRRCPKRRPALAENDVCPRCGCEAELYRRASDRCCGDCLAELHEVARAATVPPAPPARRPANHAKPVDAARAVVA
jgi:hypothetical protein